MTLKPSLVASSDASLLHSLFADLEFAAQLRWAAVCLHPSSFHVLQLSTGGLPLVCKRLAAVCAMHPVLILGQ